MTLILIIAPKERSCNHFFCWILRKLLLVYFINIFQADVMAHIIVKHILILLSFTLAAHNRLRSALRRKQISRQKYEPATAVLLQQRNWRNTSAGGMACTNTGIE